MIAAGVVCVNELKSALVSLLSANWLPPSPESLATGLPSSSPPSAESPVFTDAKAICLLKMLFINDPLIVSTVFEDKRFEETEINVSIII